MTSIKSLYSALNKKLIVKVLLPISSIILITVFAAAILISRVMRENLEESASAEITEKTKSIEQQLYLINSLMLDRVTTSLHVLKDLSENNGSPEVNGSVETNGKQLPALYFGKTLINNNYSLVDQIKDMAGGQPPFL